MAIDAFTDAWLKQTLDGVLQYFVAFTLVAVRMSGLVSIGPMFGHPDIPLQVRVLLVLSLSLLVTPAVLSVDAGQTFRRLDRDQDGHLSEGEVPPQFRTHADQLLREAGKDRGEPLAAGEFRLGLPLPRTPLDYAYLAVAEFGVGIALGLGVLTILSGLQLAGQLIDQQTGVSLGEVFNPEFDSSGSLTGAILYLLGTLIFILVGGHLLLISALMDTFRTLPVGFAFVPMPAIELLQGLVQQSLVLAIQVSAPILGTMALVGLAMGFLGHTIPQINVLVVGFPVRTLVGLLLFGLALTGMAEVIGRALPMTIEQLTQALTAE